ncbi:MAG TPA: PfkB family carbohydrate kinase, partial [Nocardioides sp.]|nr:PfkB family carbohydrate kinase [Nocardioides sp.]
GIDFVGELADRIPELCKQFDVDQSLVKLINIEAAPTALPGFDPELVEYAMQVLSKKGVTFRIGTAIKECTPDGVVELPAPPVTPVDVTGAGDAMLAAFCHRLLLGASLEEAATYGHRAAALTVASPHTVVPDLHSRLAHDRMDP